MKKKLPIIFLLLLTAIPAFSQRRITRKVTASEDGSAICNSSQRYYLACMVG